MDEGMMRAWVALALDAGLCVGEGTRLRVVGALPHRALMHAVAEGAYRRGAALVRLEYDDPRLARIRVDNSHDGFLDEVVRMSLLLQTGLREIVAEYPGVVDEVRGQGLLLGLHCVAPVGEVQAAGIAEGLLTVTAGENTLRIIPPLIVRESECEQGLAMLRRACARVAQSAKAAVP